MASISKIHRTVEAVWRIESARIIAVIARVVGDVGLAEDLAQDAFVLALERWPRSGVPDNPGAWLMTTARRRAIDRLRRRTLIAQKHDAIAQEIEALRGMATAEVDTLLDRAIDDDLLRLVFTVCHPVLSSEARVALTLRLLGGLTVPEIARAFLVPEPTMAQRIVRAKRTLREAHISFEAPHPGEFSGRLSSVLEVIYLIFNEGYAAMAGDNWMRPALCEEALRLGRILAELIQDEPEVHGLVALMEIQSSRLRTRIDASGAPILLLDQNRSKWDWLLIQRGLKALARAQGIDAPIGPYTIQAAIAACHARARTPDETDWEQIVALYDVLFQLQPTAIVALNRAVAVAMASGAAAGLEIVDRLTEESALKEYHLLPSVRADFLIRLGRYREARVELEKAASLTRNLRERRLLLDRAAALPEASNARDAMNHSGAG